MLILPEGLHKKNGSSTPSWTQVAQKASSGPASKLACAIFLRARILGKGTCRSKVVVSRRRNASLENRNVYGSVTAAILF